MLVLTPDNLLRECTDDTWRRMSVDGKTKNLRVVESEYSGHGPTGSLYIWFHLHGIGDAIHALPAVQGLLDVGTSVTIYCRPNQRPIFEQLEVETEAAIDEYLDLDKLQRHYERIIIRPAIPLAYEQSCTQPVLTRFEQFAAAFGAELPDRFDFAAVLLPLVDPGIVRRNDEYDLIALSSAIRKVMKDKQNNIMRDKGRPIIAPEATARTYTSAYQLRRLLVGHPVINPYYIGNLDGETELTSTQELVAAVAGARTVTAVDTGVLALALALGKPTIAVFGPTDEMSIALQFARYIPGTDITIVRAPTPEPAEHLVQITELEWQDPNTEPVQVHVFCRRPCNFQTANGFHVDGKCEIFADCMREITPQQIIDAIESRISDAVPA